MTGRRRNYWENGRKGAMVAGGRRQGKKLFWVFGRMKSAITGNLDDRSIDLLHSPLSLAPSFIVGEPRGEGKRKRVHAGASRFLPYFPFSLNTVAIE